MSVSTQKPAPAEMAEPQRQNKMGTAPVGRLLFSMSVPMMLSMLVQAMYNIVDSLFVARISEAQLELCAVSVAFPVQNLMIAFGTGIGVGFSTLISRSLGERNSRRAGKAAAQGILLELCCFLLFVCFGLFCLHPFFASQTENGQVVEFGVTYLSICCIGSLPLFLQLTFEKLLQSTGKALYSMITQAAGALTNIILDPILIFGLFGMPKMGVAGAALATVMGQTLGAVLGGLFHFFGNREIPFSPAFLRPNGKLIGKILYVGLPSTLMVAIGSVMTYLMNKILFAMKAAGELATTVFGIYFKLQSFVIMPVLGLNNGMIPIVAYNFGAKNRERMLRAVRISVITAVTVMLCGAAVFQIFPDGLLKLFGAGEDMLAVGEVALRTISLSFIFAGYSIVVSSVFQALGNGIYSMLVSFIRQLVVLIPVAWLFSRFGTLAQVWMAFPIAEVASMTMCTVFFVMIYRKRIRPLP